MISGHWCHDDNHADVDETKKMHLRRYLDLGRRWLQMASAGKLILLGKMTMVLKGAHSFSIFLVMPACNPIGTIFFFFNFMRLYHIAGQLLINSHRFISNKQMIWDVLFIHIFTPEISIEFWASKKCPSSSLKLFSFRILWNYVERLTTGWPTTMRGKRKRSA